MGCEGAGGRGALAREGGESAGEGGRGGAGSGLHHGATAELESIAG
jgi:hypothetical protein